MECLIFSVQVPESAVRGADLLSKPLEFFAGIHAQTLPLDPTLRHCEAVVAAPASSGGFPKCAEASSSKNRQSAPRAFNQAPSQSGQIRISRPEPGGREGDLAKCGSSKKKTNTCRLPLPYAERRSTTKQFWKVLCGNVIMDCCFLQTNTSYPNPSSTVSDRSN